MKRWLTALLTGGVLAALYAKLRARTRRDPDHQDPEKTVREPTRLKATIETDGKTFRVVPGHLDVVPGDEITWSSEATDVYFQFPVQELFVELIEERVWTRFLPRGGTVTVRVPDAVPPGEYVYAAFAGEGKRYAEGGTPPKMIVKNG